MSDHDDLPYIVIERKSVSLAAFFWGVVVGAGLALLYAPRSGEQTREDLRSGAIRLKSRAEDTVRNLQATVTDTVENLRGQVSGRLDSARDAFEAGREAARETREDLERRVRETRERVRASAQARRAAPVTEGPPSEGSTPAAPDSDLGV